MMVVQGGEERILEETEFVLSGVRYLLSRTQVINRVREVQPGPINTHAVEIDGVLYPIKEAFSRATGLDLLDFNTNQARRQFQRLGFRVLRLE